MLVLEGLVGHYSRYLLTSCFCIPIPYDGKDIFFLFVLVLEDVVVHRTCQFQLFQASPSHPVSRPKPFATVVLVSSGLFHVGQPPVHMHAV